MKKYEFKELSKNFVFSNITKVSVSDSVVEDVAISHLRKITSQEQNYEEKNSNYSNEDNQNSDKNKVLDEKEIHTKAFDEGYQKAKKESEEKIKDLQLKANFATKINSFFENLPSKENLENSYNKFFIDLLILVKDKLKFNFSPDLSEIFKENINLFLQKFYTNGKIYIYVPEKTFDIAKKVISEQDIRINRDDIVINLDEKMNDNDIILEYKDTKLEFNYNEISKDIDKIFDILKNVKDCNQN